MADHAPPASSRRRQCLLALAVLAGACVLAQAAQPASAPERRVKAAFLYKFLGYAEFPATAFADAAAPVVIGVLGADELAAELAPIVNGRTVQSRPIQVRVLHDGDSVAGVHLLFVGGADSARLRNAVKAAQPSSMLVVSEVDEGLQQGSVINFRVVDERVRFDVSLDAAEKNSVKLSSRLLTVANHVQKGAP
jgi:ABC-type sugar transport system substrate-binding protein